MLVYYNVTRICFKDGLSLKIKKINIHLYFIATQYFCNSKLGPCRRYRQLNSILYHNNHILKLSKVIVYGLVLNCVSTCGNLKVKVNQGCVAFS